MASVALKPTGNKEPVVLTKIPPKKLYPTVVAQSQQTRICHLSSLSDLDKPPNLLSLGFLICHTEIVTAQLLRIVRIE